MKGWSHEYMYMVLLVGAGVPEKVIIELGRIIDSILLKNTTKYDLAGIIRSINAIEDTCNEKCCKELVIATVSQLIFKIFRAYEGLLLAEFEKQQKYILKMAKMYGAIIGGNQNNTTPVKTEDISFIEDYYYIGHQDKECQDVFYKIHCDTDPRKWICHVITLEKLLLTKLNVQLSTYEE